MKPYEKSEKRNRALRENREKYPSLMRNQRKGLKPKDWSPTRSQKKGLKPYEKSGKRLDLYERIERDNGKK